MITLYAYKGRSRAERVLWALNELSLPFELIRIDALKGESKSPDFLALNPSGKVPVLLDGDRVLTESMAIIHYLDAKAGHHLVPQARAERQDYDARLFFLLSEVEPYLWVSDQATFLRGRYRWPRGAEGTATTLAASNLKQVHAWLRKSSYVAAERTTAADILAYHLLTWATLYLSEQPAEIASYLARLECRPAFPPGFRNPTSPAQTG